MKVVWSDRLEELYARGLEREAEKEREQGTVFPRKWYTAADAFSLAKPIEWYVDGVFAAGAVSVVVGWEWNGKELGVVSAASSIAAGVDWVGHKVKQVPVLIAEAFPGVLGAIVGSMSVEREGAIRYWIEAEALDIREKKGLVILEELVRETGAKFVVMRFPDIVGRDGRGEVRSIIWSLRRMADDIGAAIVLLLDCERGGKYNWEDEVDRMADLVMRVDYNDKKEVMSFSSLKHTDGAAFSFSADLVDTVSGVGLSYDLRAREKRGREVV